MRPQAAVLAIITLLAARAAASEPAPPQVPAWVPAGVEFLPDLAYDDAFPQRKLDLLLPRERVRAPTPVIVQVHGGGWTRGNKRSVPQVWAWLAERGYVVATIAYRLAPAARFPAQIEDVQAAVRWLRANADRYGIAAERIGVMGESAGGHLVALLGCAGDTEFASASPPAVSCRVQAVVAICAPTDFTGAWGRLAAAFGLLPLLGKMPAEAPELYRQASPVAHVRPGAPPFLIVHGDKDLVVPFHQAQALQDALRKAGVEVTLLRVENGGHTMDQPAFSGTHIPSTLERIRGAISQFFDRHLLAGLTEGVSTNGR